MNESLPVARRPITLPGVEERHARGREQHPARLGGAVRPPSRCAIGFVDRALAAEPRRLAAAAGEGEGARHAVAAVDRDRAPVGARPPGQDRPPVAEDLPRHGGRHVPGDHGAARRLAEAPRGAGVRPAHLLEDAHEGGGIELGPVERAGEEEAVEPRVEERRDQGLRQPARPLALGRGGLDQRGELLDAVEGVGAAVRAVGHGGDVTPGGWRCGRRCRGGFAGAGRGRRRRAPCRRAGPGWPASGAFATRARLGLGPCRVGAPLAGGLSGPRHPGASASIGPSWRPPSLTPPGAGRYNGRALGDRLVVGRVALDHVAEVRLLLSQPFSLSVLGGGAGSIV